MQVVRLAGLANHDRAHVFFWRPQLALPGLQQSWPVGLIEAYLGRSRQGVGGGFKVETGPKFYEGASTSVTIRR
jgi:hypothetical protein